MTTAPIADDWGRSGDNRPAAYIEEQEDGTSLSVYRASAVSGCSRALWAARMGIQGQMPPDWLLDRFEEGHQLEPVIIDRFRQWDNVEGIPGFAKFASLDPRDLKSYRDMPHVQPEYLDGDQFTAQIPVLDGVVIRGHLDGILQLYSVDDVFRQATGLDLGDRARIEVKKFRPDLFKKFLKSGLEGFPNYIQQDAAYWAATGLGCLFVVGEYLIEDDPRREETVSEIGRVVAQWVPEPLVIPFAIKSKVAKIERRAVVGEPYQECDVDQFPCPYYREYHLGEDKPSKSKGEKVGLQPVPADAAAEYDRISLKMRTAQDWTKQARDLTDEAKNELAAWLRSHGHNINPGSEEGAACAIGLRSEEFEIVYRSVRVAESTRTVKAHSRVTVTVKRLHSERTGGETAGESK